MSVRRNLFLIHTWKDSETYSEAVNLLKARDAGLADYSIPPWKKIQGSNAEVERGIRARIRSATAVVVVNSEGLHHHDWSGREMAIAVEFDKPIVVLQPRNDFRLPIPQALDGNVYRVSSWRGDALGRAIRGEVPQDNRVFDIAELRDRLDIAKMLAAGVVCASIVLAATSLNAWGRLVRELEAAGVNLEWSDSDVATVNQYCLGGAVLGGAATGLYTRSIAGAVLGAIVGALAGVAISTALVYQAALRGTRTARPDARTHLTNTNPIEFLPCPT